MDLAVELAANNALHVFQMHYAAGLRVAVAEQQGYLIVTNPAGKALPATYVKVFARAGGESTCAKTSTARATNGTTLALVSLSSEICKFQHHYTFIN
eukprot:3901657-Amphidinium_carterae.1